MSIELCLADGIAEIVLNRPDKHNAMTLEMYEDLGRAFERVRVDPSIRAAVVRGSTPAAFCAGADRLEAVPALVEGRCDISAWDGAHLKNTDVFKPVISAIDGYCFGAGFEIMLGTDIRIAARTAVFGLPEAAAGLVPAGGTLVRLVRQIPYAHAMDLLLSGRRITADEALAMGLVSQVVEPEELLATARRRVIALGSLSQHALRVIKESVIRLGDLPQSEAFGAEAVCGGEAFRSADAAEGVAAFAERRAPRFPSVLNEAGAR
ncbi:enoyl-CoA hydratase/isomerase family protein [Streptomyces sp. YIM 130001]|uniref:enoyl-CoA hydratase/isomerase family protein n=1 Tax=Streptomyces sp. YIM 130001 TaxID=2259644 RepID=UPI000E64853F|nr:enoyl-CoA hydratase/isomerase family protein [Streptomyces sp. YIM 130001]